MAAVVLVVSLVASATSATAVPAGGAPRPTGARRVAVRVMTWNIHAGAGQDGRVDVTRLAGTIRDSGAEVVGLQEVDVHFDQRSGFENQVELLADQLDMPYFFAPIYSFDPPAPGRPRREYGLAVLSRHPLVTTENHSLTRSSLVPDPVPEPLPGFPEVLVQVRGATFRFYNTHLDFRPDPAIRTAQVAETLQVLAADREAKVLVGDLNADPGAPELAPLFGKLRDAWVLTGEGSGLTYPAGGATKRLDYVLASPDVRVRTAAVIPTVASDHLPVVADLELWPAHTHR